MLVGGGPSVVPAVTKDGRRLDISLSLTDVSADGARRTALAVIRDVSEQLRIERGLAAANATLRAFVATASHDLRAPLTTVLGYARVLRDAGDKFTESRRAEMLAAIARGAQQANRLVEDLLTLSQIHAGAIAVVPQAVSVAAVVDASNVQTGAQAEAVVDPTLHVWCDPDHLDRMLVNYLSNATRHGMPPIRVTAERRGETIEVRVSDSGPGVPPEFVDRLFTSFARADPTAKNSTGLGLSIVKGLADANGGRAFYVQHPQHGPFFAVQLRPPAPNVQRCTRPHERWGAQLGRVGAGVRQARRQSG